MVDSLYKVAEFYGDTMRFYRMDRNNYCHVEEPIINFFKNFHKTDYVFNKNLKIQYNNTNLDFVSYERYESYENHVLKEIAEIKSLKEYKLYATNWIKDHQERLEKISDIFILSIGSLAIVVIIECQLKIYIDKTNLDNGWLIMEEIDKFRLCNEISEALSFLKEKRLIKNYEFFAENNLGFINIQV